MEEKINIISSERESAASYLRKVWKYRHLAFALTTRDLKSAYAQTFFGWFWLFIKPLLVLIMFTVFFNEWLNLETGTLEYPAFVFTGMSIWYFFSNLVHNTGSALINSGNLVTKIYFPRILLILSKSFVAIIELAVNIFILAAMMVYYGYCPKITWLLFLPIILLVYALGISIGIWVNTLSNTKRDIQHLIPHLVNMAIWFTPVFYPVTIIPESYRHYLYLINPVASFIDWSRYFLFDFEKPSAYLWANLILIIVLLTTGFYFFLRKEKTIIDKL